MLLKNDTYVFEIGMTNRKTEENIETSIFSNVTEN